MFKIFEVGDDYLLPVMGKIIGKDKDIIFYDIEAMSSLSLHRANFTQLPTYSTNDSTNRCEGYFETFCFQEYWRDIWKSYRSSEQNVLSQLELDFARQHYVVDNFLCSSLKDYAQNAQVIQANQTNNLGNIDNVGRWTFDKENNGNIGKLELDICANKNLDLRILMCGTQAAFGLLLEVLARRYPNTAMLSSDMADGGPQIRLTSNANSAADLMMEIRISKRVYHLDAEKVTATLDCSLSFPLVSKSKNGIDTGIISWTEVKIK